MNALAEEIERLTTPALYWSTSVSDCGKLVNEEYDSLLEDYERPVSVGAKKKSLLRELEDLVVGRIKSGYFKGEEGRRFLRAFNNAIKFIHIIPNELERPELSIEPDGEVAFDWINPDGRYFSVSVGSDPVVHYAAIIGSSKQHGAEGLRETFPSQFGLLAQRVA